MTRILLIDGDIIAYKAAFASEKAHDFGDGNWALTADEDAAHDHVKQLVAALGDKVSAERIIVCLSDDANWRKEIYPAYKQQRTKTRKPVLLKPLKSFMAAEYEVFIRPTLEADDVLGILATWEGMPGMKIIASIDKDLLQIPGRHLNINSGAKSVVTEAQGDRLHMLQTLTGDVVDNYPGLPTCGPVKAKAILDIDTPPWPAVVAAYEKKGLTEDDALVQARVSRVCRASDYDFSTKSVRLWTPPSH